MPRAHLFAMVDSAPPVSQNRTFHFRWLIIGAAALAALVLPAIHRPQLWLVWNVSASVPSGLYAIAPGVRLEVGDLVAVRPSPELRQYMAERRYVEADALLIKPVAAMSGTTVCRKGFSITIAGRPTVTALPRDRLGRPLPRWSGCRRLRHGQLFLIAPTNAASFDSRYFGAASSSQIVGRATPLWTRL